MFVRKVDLPKLPKSFQNPILKDVRVVMDCTPVQVLTIFLQQSITFKARKLILLNLPSLNHYLAAVERRYINKVRTQTWLGHFYVIISVLNIF